MWKSLVRLFIVKHINCTSVSRSPHFTHGNLMHFVGLLMNCHLLCHFANIIFYAGSYNELFMLQNSEETRRGGKRKPPEMDRGGHGKRSYNMDSRPYDRSMLPPGGFSFSFLQKQYENLLPDIEDYITIYKLLRYCIVLSPHCSLRTNNVAFFFHFCFLFWNSTFQIKRYL